MRAKRRKLEIEDRVRKKRIPDILDIITTLFA